VVVPVIDTGAAFFAVLHGFEHIFFTKNTVLFSKLFKVLIIQKVNVANARVEELSHQEGDQQSKHHEKVDCSESDGFFGCVLRFV
jgi:hypothetical protein